MKPARMDLELLVLAIAMGLILAETVDLMAWPPRAAVPDGSASRSLQAITTGSVHQTGRSVASASPEPQGQAPKPEEPAKPEGQNKPSSVILTAKLIFMADPRLFPYDIEVEITGDKAVLSGKVASTRDKLAAVSAARKLRGIATVVDRLEVVKDLNRTMARQRDEIVTRYVKERFAKSKTLQAADFEVKTEDGVVTLSGKTRFQVILLEAAEAAREVPGVRAVRTGDVHLEGEE